MNKCRDFYEVVVSQFCIGSPLSYIMLRANLTQSVADSLQGIIIASTAVHNALLMPESRTCTALAAATRLSAALTCTRRASFSSCSACLSLLADAIPSAASWAAGLLESADACSMQYHTCERSSFSACCKAAIYNFCAAHAVLQMPKMRLDYQSQALEIDGTEPPSPIP